MQHLHRSNAPETSVAAAEAVNTSQLETLVHRVIESFGPDGCISDQVREKMLGFAYSSVTARYAALIDKGLIFVVEGDVRKGATGRNQRVMRSTIYAN